MKTEIETENTFEWMPQQQRQQHQQQHLKSMPMAINNIEYRKSLPKPSTRKRAAFDMHSITVRIESEYCFS